jgi:hypothetical protein
VEHHYRAKERPTVSDEAWNAASPVAKQALLGATLQQVADYTHIAAASGGFDRADAHLTRTALRLDEDGWHELSHAFTQWLEEIDRIEEAATARIEEGGDDTPTLDAGLVLMFFEAARFSDQVVRRTKDPDHAPEGAARAAEATEGRSTEQD